MPRFVVFGNSSEFPFRRFVGTPDFRFVVYAAYSAVICGWFGSFYYVADLFSHFYLQYAVALCLVLPWYAYRKFKKEAAMAVVGIAYFVPFLAGADFSGFSKSAPELGADLLYMNSEYRNRDLAPILDYVRATAPETVAMVELNEELAEKLRKDFGFEYAFHYPKKVLSFGFFTHEKVLEQELFFIGQYPVGRFRTESREYYVVHPLPPMSGELHSAQKAFFEEMAGRVRGKTDFVIVGDFNSTPYSPVFRSNFGGFQNVTAYSWGTDSILSIPIDNVISAKPADVRT